VGDCRLSFVEGIVSLRFAAHIITMDFPFVSTRNEIKAMGVWLW
jgi:hypothetical protein